MYKDLLKKAMRHMPAPISLITTINPENGLPVGLAASAVIPVSMDPPSMLISINTGASACSPISSSGKYCINLLTAEQTSLVAPFSDSTRRNERFSTDDWELRNGIPYLPAASSAIFCDVRMNIPFATHTLFIGEVDHIVCKNGSSSPLGWLEGQFATLKPLAS